MKISKRLFVYIILIIFGFSAMLLLSNTLLLRPLYHWFVKGTMLSAMDEYEDIDFSAETSVWVEQVAVLSMGKAFDVVIKSENLVLFSSSKEAGILSMPGGLQTGPRSGTHNQGFFISAQNFEGLKEHTDGIKIGIVPFMVDNTELMVCMQQGGDGTTIFLTQAIAPLDKNVTQANILLLGCTILSLIILVFVVLRISKHFTKPITEIQSTVGQMARLNFENRCVIKTGDELQNLGEDVNLLADKLKYALGELKRKNEQLEKDIEAQKKFIANASHELRTPLSLIKGYSDEMSTGYVKEQTQSKEYAGIIADEAAKMTRLLTDMLELSRMQSGQAVMKKEVLSASNHIRFFIEKYDGFIETNGLIVTLCLEDDTMGVFDPLHFEQVLANYISNAAKYGDYKKQIRISASSVGEFIRISVFNSGLNINPDKIDSIWDGFYKTDEARTRSAGSYGLGLSIVKAIQTSIGCGFGAVNVFGGVEFWFEVPKFRDDKKEV